MACALPPTVLLPSLQKTEVYPHWVHSLKNYIMSVFFHKIPEGSNTIVCKSSVENIKEVTIQTPDGPKVNPSIEVGLVAQDVLDIEKANGYGADNDNSLLVNLTDDQTRYGLNYTKIVPILISAIKELSAKVDALES